ncbi:MAG TPA: radical SAM/SPASM domain-containing protein [Thermoanaerobaculia bacterium]|nr:radical SAM/SPASM domain-containing protein [Thermoanaerobaculia bacterium]
MAASHGWALIDAERKREIIAAICDDAAPRGPLHVELDLTDRCNVACYFCNQQDVRTSQQLPLAQIASLLDELVGGGLRSVRLSGGGDPLFHKQIATVLDELTARGVVIDNLTTNGALLGPDIARRLVANGCREVIFSLNAADAADYHRMMAVKPGTFDKVCENISHLAAVRGTPQGSTQPQPASDAPLARPASGSPQTPLPLHSPHPPLPLIVVQFLIDRENADRIPDMYRLGASLGADRLTIAPVLEIPRERIEHDRLLASGDGELIRSHLEQILAWDRGADLLQLAFPYQEWNGILRQARYKVAGRLDEPLAPAASFRERDGQCFFGYYTATIRGNGDLYPCCMLMHPDYRPLGNALTGSFADHWQGPAFARLRTEMRELLLRGGRMFFRRGRFRTLGRQCVAAHQCGLKNMYFRHDEEFYADLARALDAKRAIEVRWLGAPRQLARAAEVLAFRIYHGLRVRTGALLARAVHR